MIIIKGAFGKKYRNVNFCRTEWERSTPFMVVQSTNSGPNVGDYISVQDYLKNYRTHQIIFNNGIISFTLENGI